MQANHGYPMGCTKICGMHTILRRAVGTVNASPWRQASIHAIVTVDIQENFAANRTDKNFSS